MEKFICKKCYEPYDINKHDEEIIKSISTPENYFVKKEYFVCRKCLEKEYLNKNAEIIEFRKNLKLEIDKTT